MFSSPADVVVSDGVCDALVKERVLSDRFPSFLYVNYEIQKTWFKRKMFQVYCVAKKKPNRLEFRLLYNEIKEALQWILFLDSNDSFVNKIL